MPSNSSITSIVKPGAFSSGASRSGFITRWGLSLLEQATLGVIGDPDSPLAGERPASGVRLVHEIRFHPDETVGGVQGPCYAFARILCHLLVNQIPDRGIPELCESVLGMYHFYSTQGEQPPLLPLTETITARRGRTYERPEFHLDVE